MKSLSVAAIAVLLASTSAFAAEEPAKSTTTTTTTQMTRPGTEAVANAAAGRFRASKMDGVAIYNEQGDKIGTVQDLILAADGRVDTVVIGVGGFLGMGEHNVGIPYAQVKWSAEPGKTTASNATTTTSTTSGTTGAATSATGHAYPDHGTIAATKDQLKAMPEFKF